MIAALRCIDVGVHRATGACYTLGKVYPVADAAEHHAPTGLQAFRWVRIFDDNNFHRILDRMPAGTYKASLQSGASVFELTIG